MATGWGTPVLLTGTEPGGNDPFNGLEDFSSLPSGDLCHLGGGMVIAMIFSYDSYAVRLWAIDTLGDVPDVGPVKVVNVEDASWMDHPHPVDPKGMAFYPSTWCVRTGPNTFAISGPAYETYDASGNLDGSGSYIHAASFFQVNLTTKEITRTAFVVVDYHALGTGPGGGWVDDHCLAAWDNSPDGAVVLTELDSDFVMVIHPDGTTEPYLLPGYPTATFPVAPAVVGDTCLFLAESSAAGDDVQVFSMNLNTGALTAGPVLVGSTDWMTDFFATPTSTGMVAFLTSSGHAGSSSAIDVSIVDPTALTAVGPTHIVPEGVRNFGWTGAFLGNIKSITQLSGGRTLVSAIGVFTRTMFIVRVSNLGAPGTPEDVPLPNPVGRNPQMGRSVVVNDNRFAAMWVRQTSGGEGSVYTYGPNFIVWRGEAELEAATDTRYTAKAKLWSPR